VAVEPRGEYYEERVPRNESMKVAASGGNWLRPTGC
jgi:hypothetical protein